MDMLKAHVKSALKSAVRAVSGVLDSNAAGRVATAELVDSIRTRTRAVMHNGVSLRFSVPNELSVFRAESFATKEPETLEWIDQMETGSVLWDIGANVGLYSCYAAKHRACRVFAFEPSVFNLESLARNFYLNGLGDRVTIVPVALTDRSGPSTLSMSSTEWGGALSSFGQSYGHDGGPIQIVFEFPTVGMSMVDAASALGIPQPDYVKIDVDGIEHVILKAGGAVLRGAKSVLVEINDQFTAQATESSRYLREAGFKLTAKRHAAMYDAYPGAERYTFNQIWSR